jgi:hypothetical protein
MTIVTYYDFSDLRFVSLFINGLLANEKERGYRFEISRGLPPEFEDLDPAANLITGMIPVSLYRVNGRDPFLFCIDGDDKSGADEPLGEFFRPFLERCKYYFKVNYNADVIAQKEELKPFAAKIKPVPVVYPIAPLQPWRLRPKVTPINGRSWPLQASRRRIRYLRTFTSLDNYRRMRNRDRDIDVFCNFILYNQPKYKEMIARRRAVVDGLNQFDQFNIVAGYACSDNLPCGPYESELMDQRTYLDLNSRSRVGVYVRGNHDCLAFKFGELMAMGKPIVGETLFNNQENMYAYDRFDEQFAFDDPQELVARVIYLLEHPAELQELREINTATFENHFAPKPLVKNILDQIGIG